MANQANHFSDQYPFVNLNIGSEQKLSYGRETVYTLGTT